MEKTAEEIVIALAEWSKKYPRSQVYGMSRKETIDGELIAIEEMAKAYNPQESRTEGASAVPTDEEVRKACPEDCLSDWILGAKWMREKMLKAKWAEYDVLREKINKYQDDSLKHLNEYRHYKTKKEKELKELKAERKEAISVLRELCKDFGDNDWEEDLHMADIIDKHLAKRLYYEQTLQPNNTLSKAKVLEILKDSFPQNLKYKNLSFDKAAYEICSLPNAATSADKELLWKFFERGNDHDYNGEKNIRKDFENFYACFNFNKSNTSAEAVNKAIEALEYAQSFINVSPEAYKRYEEAISELKQSNHQ